jgi:hypothetical protein
MTVTERVDPETLAPCVKSGGLRAPMAHVCAERERRSRPLTDFNGFLQVPGYVADPVAHRPQSLLTPGGVMFSANTG